MKVNLVAVQAKPILADYASPKAFYAKMEALTRRATAAVDPSHPTLVAFPEAIGFFLSFVPFWYDEIKHCRTIAHAFLTGVPRHLLLYLTACWQHRVVGIKTVGMHTALAAERVYRETFASLAREYGIYLLGGSIYLPPIDDDPVCGPRTLSNTFYNVAHLFSPQGVCLGRTPKINIMPPWESKFGVRRGRPADLRSIDTALGRLGILICRDGFHSSLVEHYDAQGVRIILNPSHNRPPWNGPAKSDQNSTKGEVWLRRGLPATIQGRENIAYGVCPMMVGSIFDVAAEGRSLICRNIGYTNASPEDGILAMAATAIEEEIVAASVEVPEERPVPASRV